MAEYSDREHFIPLRKTDLVDLLCSDADFPGSERDLFLQFCRLISATYHFEGLQRLDELKDAYAPFDPDSATKKLKPLLPEERRRRQDELFSDFDRLMERANFTHLPRDAMAAALKESSAWGINMDVDFGVFERLEVYYRGDTSIKRSRRRMRKLWRVEETQVPTYQRLVLILKLKAHKRLGARADTDNVYLKIFKDIPKLDIEMLLPGARVQFTHWDRSKIGLPFLSGLAMALWNIIQEIARFFQAALMNPGPLLWGAAVGGLGYGYKSWSTYKSTKEHYSLSLTESLYYQNLDNNEGVLFHLMDEAEEQEFREAVLAYFLLWRKADATGWTSGELDDAVEEYLEQNAGLKVDFEIGDALAKLERARIVKKADGRYLAAPLAEALETLDWTWDNYFKFNKQEGA